MVVYYQIEPQPGVLMSGPIAINVHLVNQGIPSPTIADFPGFTGSTIILVVFAYL